MNLPPGPEIDSKSTPDAIYNKSLLHLIFDAVYKLNSECEEARFTQARKNIDLVHFDMS